MWPLSPPPSLTRSVPKAMSSSSWIATMRSGGDLVERRECLDRAAGLVHVAAGPGQDDARASRPATPADPRRPRRGRTCAPGTASPSARRARRRRGSRRCGGGRRTTGRGCPGRPPARRRRSCGHPSIAPLRRRFIRYADEGTCHGRPWQALERHPAVQRLTDVGALGRTRPSRVLGGSLDLGLAVSASDSSCSMPASASASASSASSASADICWVTLTTRSRRRRAASCPRAARGRRRGSGCRSRRPRPRPRCTRGCGWPRPRPGRWSSR